MHIFKLRLEARNSEINCYRFWDVSIERDLLGDLLLVKHWGRIGAFGSLKKTVVSDIEEAKTLVLKHIARRRYSSKRLGVFYVEISRDDPEGLFEPQDIVI